MTKTRKLASTHLLTFLVTAIGVGITLIYLYEQPSYGENVVHDEMRSAVLGEDREVLVHLPESYASCSDRSYPVVYVLDGSSQDVHTAFSAALLARIGLAPEMIVVGLPNTSGPNRQRDYTPPSMIRDRDEPDGPLGGGDAFLRFLEAEVMPKIDTEYRTAPYRMLAGNSRGGLLVTHSLVAAPDLFDARFAHSPALWRDDRRMVAELGRFLASGESPAGSFYLSMGDKENEKMVAAFEETVERLERNAPVGLRWRAVFTRGAHHGNNALRATPVGLRWLFADDPVASAASTCGNAPRPAGS